VTGAELVHTTAFKAFAAGLLVLFVGFVAVVAWACREMDKDKGPPFFGGGL
jgi:hypothetical protein